MQDGWLKTGDVGHLDAEGYVTITDRKKDMIVVSGFKVFPNEIESVVATHPGVLECGAVGVPDDEDGRGGESGDREEGSGSDAGGVIDYCRTQLTGYKVPRLRGVPQGPAEITDRKGAAARVARRA